MNNTDLIWRNLSDFWGKIPEEDRTVIETLWEGWAQCLDAEYAQLYQMDFAKALATCPVFSKYRWCLLDLSAKNLTKVNDYIKSIKKQASVTQTTGSAINDQLAVANHVDHRHFYIRPKYFNKEIKLPFGVEPALVEGFRIYNGTSLNGSELAYGPDYVTGNNSIKLGTTVDSTTQVGFFVGINETKLAVNNTWFRYSEVALESKSLFILPSIYDETIGVMVFVDGKYLGPSDIVLETSNSISLNIPVTGLVEFIWYLKDPNAKFNEFHEHHKQYFIFNPDAISGTGVAGSVSYLPLNPSQSVGSEIRYSGPESQIRVFVGGNFYPEEFWKYDPSTGNIIFNTALSWIASEFVPISVEFSDIQNDTEFEESHIHVIREYSNVSVALTSSTFDDGGRFDDGGLFDSVEEENQYTLPFEVEDINSLRVYFNGKYLYYQYDYTISSNNKTLFFNFSIKSGNFRFEYTRPSGRYSYGASDLDGLTSAQIRKANLLLFYNEDTELMSEFDVNSPEETTKALDAYKLAGQDTYCVSIPVLQNRVDNSDVKYLEKTLTTKGDYKIVNGGIQSDVKLPEFLWCPVVYFDESLLAKNFGVLVDFQRIGSSESYKQALNAIWSGLWNGPIIENVEWIISMFLNIPFIPDNGKIGSIVKSLVYTEIITDSDKYYLDNTRSTTLIVGDQIYLGQSLDTASKFSGEVSFTSVGEYGSTRLEIPNLTIYANTGDLISLSNGSSAGVYKVLRTEDDSVILSRTLTGSVGLIQDDTFDDTVSYDLVENSIAWPQFSQNVEVGSYIYFSDVYTSVKIVDKIQGRLVLETSPPITVTSGINFKIFNKTTYAVLQSSAPPLVKRDAIVRSVTRAYMNRIYLTSGAYVDVPSEFELDVVEGQIVSKFQPVSYQVSVYDDSLRKDWLYEKNSAFNEKFRTGGNDTTERILDSVCDIDGFWITDLGVDFIGRVSVGDTINISSGINATIYAYTVSLVRNHQLKVSNELSKDVSVTYSVDKITKYEAPEDKPRQVSVIAPVEVTLLDSITTSTLNIKVDNIDKLPDSGVLKASVNGNVEFIKYGYKVGSEVRDCIRLFNKNSGNIPLQLNVGSKLELIFEFSGKAIREVFYAGMRAISDIVDNKYITDNAESLYSITKNNTTVIEMFTDSGINKPDLANITDFMRKILPSSSFWFIDINKGINDVDERDPEETAVLARQHFNCVKLSEIATYVNTGTISTSYVSISSSNGLLIGDMVFFPSFTNKYGKITAISGVDLTLDRLLDASATTTATVISAINLGTCEEQAIDAIYSVDIGIQKGCTLTIIDGMNVGQYAVKSVVGNRIVIDGKFPELGNSIRYNFYVTSNEGSIL